MSYLSAKASIESYLITNWTETQIKLDNTTFNTSGVDKFISPILLPTTSGRELMNSAKPYLDSYILHINVFIRTSVGSGAAMSLVDLLDAMLKEKKIGDLMIEVPDVNIVGNDGDFYQVAVKFPARQWR